MPLDFFFFCLLKQQLCTAPVTLSILPKDDNTHSPPRFRCIGKLAVSAQKENTFKQEESQEGFIFFCSHVKEEKKLVKTSRCGKKTVKKMTDCSLAKVSHSQMLLCEM